MANKAQVNWSDILSKFSSYEGTTEKFCNENHIKAHQLYYHRKKATKNNPPVFHGIKVTEQALTHLEVATGKPCLKANTHIKIELGKANIYIPSNDRLALENVLQIVISTC